MAYEVVMPYHLHMPSYFLETFTEYPFVNLKSNTMKNTLQIYGHLLKIQVLESNQCVL